MALVLCEGFELVTNTTGTGTRSALIEYLTAIGCSGSWETFTNGIFVAEAADAGKYALSFGDDWLSDGQSVIFPFPTAYGIGAELWIGFRVKMPTGSDSWNLCTVKDATIDVAVKLQVQNTSNLVFQRGGTTLGTATAVLVPGSWHYIEFYFKWHSTGAYEIRVDGTNVLSNGSVNTKDAFCDAVAAVMFKGSGASPSSQCLIDDIYVCDASGTQNNGFLGHTTKVRGFRPNADGSLSEWTPSAGTDHYALVDEAPASSTDYVETAIAGNHELFEMQPVAFDTVYAVQAEACVLLDGLSVRDLHLQTVSGVVTEDGTTAAVASENSIVCRHIFETDPNASAAWTTSTINNAEFGVELE